MSAILRVTAIVPEGPAGSLVTGVCLSADGRHVGYAAHGGGAPGLYVARAGQWSSARRVFAFDAPRADADAPRAARAEFSPDGRLIAYAMYDAAAEPASPLGVAWCALDGSAPGACPGVSLAWTPKSRALVVAHPAEKLVLRADVSSGKARPLSGLLDDGDPQFPPRIRVSPDGTRLAFTVRRVEEELSEVWIARRSSEGTSAELFTEVPGAGAFIEPFWSADGRHLGLFIVHAEQGKSVLVLVPRLEGEGELVYDSPRLDPSFAPAWSPSGRTIAFFHRPAEGAPQLALLEVPRRGGPARVTLASEHDLPDGHLAFRSSKELVVWGAARAAVVHLAQDV